jgi:hypothetical protein
MRYHRAASMTPGLAITLLAGCSSGPDNPLEQLPSVDDYCLTAQRVVTNTEQPVEVVIHDDFTAFVKSKAVIEGPTIQQYNWIDDDGNVVGISCKLKSADHLNLAFGDGSAGPDGLCQDMNRAVFMLIAPTMDDPAYHTVTFDLNETVVNEEQPGMTGPDWLAPYEATSLNPDGALIVRSKGFIVNFTDPQFAKAPPRFRGVHYCHFIAPDHLAALLAGDAKPGLTIGRSPEGMGRGY